MDLVLGWVCLASHPVWEREVSLGFSGRLRFCLFVICFFTVWSLQVLKTSRILQIARGFGGGFGFEVIEVSRLCSAFWVIESL